MSYPRVLFPEDTQIFGTNKIRGKKTPRNRKKIVKKYLQRGKLMLIYHLCVQPSLGYRKLQPYLSEWRLTEVLIRRKQE